MNSKENIFSRATRNLKNFKLKLKKKRVKDYFSFRPNLDKDENVLIYYTKKFNIIALRYDE